MEGECPVQDNKPILALMYDFDHTLSPRDMQEYAFIPELNMAPGAFWDLCQEAAARHQMDSILAYMYVMLREAKKRGMRLTRQNFIDQGAKVELFPGVDTWFERINAYGESLGFKVEHYVLSSGLKEIIEGTTIAKYFKKIYACEFMYRNGHAVWPKLAVNYTSKTQFVYRINKGVLDINNNVDLNNSRPDNQKRVFFSNMIYIGDGLTDVPSMKVVKTNGGQSIAVYDPAKGRAAAAELLSADRVNFIAPADYREGGELETVVRAIMWKIQAVEGMMLYQP